VGLEIAIYFIASSCFALPHNDEKEENIWIPACAGMTDKVNNFY
jgi:hypothetical protein